MKTFFAITALALVVCASIPVYGQSFFATVTGTVTDTSGALIPGVTIRASAVDTGVVTSTITNEAGTYTFGNLLPGRYTITAALPGFQAKNLTGIDLSAGTAYRFNFELSVASVSTQVEVSIATDSILATQGATVGEVLTAQKVQALPLVGNNILDLITVMAGVENIVPTNPPSAGNAFGRENTTFAGVRADAVTIVRDGIQMQDNRNPTGVYSVTTINPDLVGEIRLILAPVDVEFGRGNGSIQYSTRSGTNRYNGAATWSFRNTALDPNTWTNNRNQTLRFDQPAGSRPEAIKPNWTNTHQITISYGGPIIRNKTFFFALFDFNQSRGRHLANVTVPTACARQGIFRYFDGWTNDDAASGADGTGSNASRVSVNLDGTPKAPTGLPVGSTLVLPQPYDPSLRAVSVFGPLSSAPRANDCSDAPINRTTLVPNGVTTGALPGAGGGWDRYRQQIDLTGYIRRVMAFYPLPNNFETGDGLTTAGYRFLRGYKGVDNLWGAGEATGDRRQYNVKIDHNFSNNHKANFNISYERVDSDDVKAGILGQETPDMFSNLNYRRPVVLSGGFTSTLSASLLNEARFGMRRQGINVIAPWHRSIYDKELAALLPPLVGGNRVIPNFLTLGMCNPHTGSRPPGSGCLGLTGTQREKTPTYTYSDTVSWTVGSHSFRFNGELRLNASETQGPTTGGFGSANSSFLTVPNGSITGTTAGSTSNTDLANTNPAMIGLTTGNGTNARSLMGYLAGSLGNIQTLYYLGNPNNTSAWSDYRNGELITVKAKQTEITAFAKDEWKVAQALTLTPGIRWDYYGVPYLNSGLTVAPIGGGAAAFGISGRDFTGWMNPGARAEATTFELVGPNSPNPNKTAYPNNYHNFGPSLSFAWQLPWFGEGKTTVRGGYQITYQAGGRFGSVAPALASAPGTNFQAAFTTQNVYLDLANLNPAAVPVPNVQPLQGLLTTGPRTASYTTFDPSYTSPYVQNLSLQITRSVSRSLTVDVRYIGTLSRKNYSQVNLNTSNFLYNGLLEALGAVRTGTEITKNAGDPLSLLDRMFAGVNLCTGTNCTALAGGRTYGTIGTTTGSGATALYQSAAMQMRSSTAFQANLADASFNAIAGTIANLNGNLTVPTGTVGAALRLNGFPENFIRTNPQFNNMNLNTNSAYNNYHALQAEASLRPIQGFSGQITYNWSKNLGLLGGVGEATNAGTLTNPVDRRVDYTNINNNPGHSIRTNGLVELPIGPNKLLLGNSSGFLARMVERWQLGLIYNLSTGAPVSLTASTMLYGNGLPDVRHPVDFKKLRGVRWGTPSGSFLEGRYFDNNDVFVKVDDPSCFQVTNLQNLSGLAPATGSPTLRCNLNALAMVVPAGTPDSYVETDGRTVQIVLQHPQPGKKGNLGNSTIIGLGNWRFDANLAKSFRIDESKALALRIDMQNVMNHPQPGNPNFSITGNNPFGQIATKSGGRLLQGQLRLTF